MADTLKTEWPLCVCMDFCACVCLCQVACLQILSALRAPNNHYPTEGSVVSKCWWPFWSVIVATNGWYRNTAQSNPRLNACLCASVVNQACESDLRWRVTLRLYSAWLARGLRMNPYLKPSAVKRNAEASALNGLDRLDRLIQFY